MRISLVPKEIVAIGGDEARLKEDLRQLGLENDTPWEEPPVGFQDIGLVLYEGNEYYMSWYDSPTLPDLDQRYEDEWDECE